MLEAIQQSLPYFLPVSMKNYSKNYQQLKIDYITSKIIYFHCTIYL